MAEAVVAEVAEVVVAVAEAEAGAGGGGGGEEGAVAEAVGAVADGGSSRALANAMCELSGDQVGE